MGKSVCPDGWNDKKLHNALNKKIILQLKYLEGIFRQIPAPLGDTHFYGFQLDPYLEEFHNNLQGHPMFIHDGEIDVTLFGRGPNAKELRSDPEINKIGDDADKIFKYLYPNSPNQPITDKQVQTAQSSASSILNKSTSNKQVIANDIQLPQLNVIKPVDSTTTFSTPQQVLVFFGTLFKQLKQQQIDLNRKNKTEESDTTLIIKFLCDILGITERNNFLLYYAMMRKAYDLVFLTQDKGEFGFNTIAGPAGIGKSSLNLSILSVLTQLNIPYQYSIDSTNQMGDKIRYLTSFLIFNPHQDKNKPHFKFVHEPGQTQFFPRDADARKYITKTTVCIAELPDNVFKNKSYWGFCRDWVTQSQMLGLEHDVRNVRLSGYSFSSVLHPTNLTKLTKDEHSSLVKLGAVDAVQYYALVFPPNMYTMMVGLVQHSISQQMKADSNFFQKLFGEIDNNDVKSFLGDKLHDEIKNVVFDTDGGAIKTIDVNDPKNYELFKQIALHPQVLHKISSSSPPSLPTSSTPSEHALNTREANAAIIIKAPSSPHYIPGNIQQYLFQQTASKIPQVSLGRLERYFDDLWGDLAHILRYTTPSTRCLFTYLSASTTTVSSQVAIAAATWSELLNFHIIFPKYYHVFDDLDVKTQNPTLFSHCLQEMDRKYLGYIP